MSLLTMLLVVPLGILAFVLWLLFCIALEEVTRSKAERVALAQFKIDYPNIRPGFLGKQRDGELDIVMVTYDSTRPPRRKYYAVNQNQIAKEVEDDSKYRPKFDR